MEGHPESFVSSKNQDFKPPQLMAQAWKPIHSFAMGCKFDPLWLTAKKLDAKLFLQDLHMAADSSLADVQIQSCLVGEALVTNCRLKGVKRIQ
jgi:hypothetical protein